MTSVDLKQSPRLYSLVFPAGSDVLGVVDRDGQRGALVRIRATGMLVQVNAGVVRSLPRDTERAVAVALRDPEQARSYVARVVGSVKSEAKAAASRANGALGGRPKKSRGTNAPPENAGLRPRQRG